MIWQIIRILLVILFVVIAYLIYSEPDVPVQTQQEEEVNFKDFHGEYRIDSNKTLTVDQHNSQLIIGLSYEF